MIDFITAINTANNDILTRKMIAAVVSSAYEDYDMQRIISTIIIKGFVIDIRLKRKEFKIFLIDQHSMWLLFKKQTSYNLVNYIQGFREWFEKELNNNFATVLKIAKEKRVNNFQFLVDQRLFTMYEKEAIKRYQLGICSF